MTPAMHAIALALVMATAWPGNVNPLPAIFPDTSANVDSPLALHEWRQEFSNINPNLTEWWFPGWNQQYVDTDTPFDFIITGAPIHDDYNAISAMVAFSSRMAMRDARLAKDEPVPRDSTWATGESVKVPVYGSVFVFGSVDAGSESVEEQHLRWAGKTGVGMKVDPWLLESVQVRGGRTISYDDADRPLRTSAPVPERSELFIDVSTKLPVPILSRPVNLEYSGTSPPPATSYEKPRLNQDVKLALPFADGQSKVSVGAKLAREETPSPTPWFDRAQLYLGVELKH